MLYDRLGDENKADSHFERAVALEPKNPEFKNNYAVYLCQKKKFERGQKMALEAAADPLYKTPEVALHERRQLRAQRRRPEGRRGVLPPALAAKPRFGEALFQMADLEYRQTEYMSARAFLAALPRSGPHQPRDAVARRAHRARARQQGAGAALRAAPEEPNIRRRPRPRNCWSPSGIRDE